MRNVGENLKEAVTIVVAVPAAYVAAFAGAVVAVLAWATVGVAERLARR